LWVWFFLSVLLYLSIISDTWMWKKSYAALEGYLYRVIGCGCVKKLWFLRAPGRSRCFFCVVVAGSGKGCPVDVYSDVLCERLGSCLWSICCRWDGRGSWRRDCLLRPYFVTFTRKMLVFKIIICRVVGGACVRVGWVPYVFRCVFLFAGHHVCVGFDVVVYCVGARSTTSLPALDLDRDYPSWTGSSDDMSLMTRSIIERVFVAWSTATESLQLLISWFVRLVLWLSQPCYGYEQDSANQFG